MVTMVIGCFSIIEYNISGGSFLSYVFFILVGVLLVAGIVFYVRRLRNKDDWENVRTDKKGIHVKSVYGICDERTRDGRTDRDTD